MRTPGRGRGLSSTDIRKILAVRLRPSWGYAIRIQPQSKMRAALRFPPPTTAMGALAYPLLLIRGDRREVLSDKRPAGSSAELVRREVEHVAISVLARTLTHGSLHKVNQLYRGKVFPSITALPSVFIYSEGESWVDVAFILGRGAHDVEELERAGWGITRLGSRESLFSAESVEVVQGERRRTTEVETRFTFTLRDGMTVEGSYEVLQVVDPSSSIGDYSQVPKTPLCYPAGVVRVRSEEPLETISFDVWGKTEEVIIR